MATQPTDRHIWYSPADCAAMLDGTQHGDHWRAACPAHAGSNRQALRISQGHDRYGNPSTLLHCFAYGCPIEDICAAMGIEVRHLFCIHPDYARATRNAPRSRSSRIARLKSMEDPTPDAIAQVLLEEMIVSDPAWIQTCAPARQKMWELAQDDPRAEHHFTKALQSARLNPLTFWHALEREIKA